MLYIVYKYVNNFFLMQECIRGVNFLSIFCFWCHAYGMNAYMMRSVCYKIALCINSSTQWSFLHAVVYFQAKDVCIPKYIRLFPLFHGSRLSEKIHGLCKFLCTAPFLCKSWALVSFYIWLLCI